MRQGFLSVHLVLCTACVGPPGPATTTAPPTAPTGGPNPTETIRPAEARGLVAKVLDDFHAAAAAADEERYFSHLAEDSVFLGTDAKERWTKSQFRTYAAPHFARGKAWSFRAQRRSIALSDDGDWAWFEEQLDTPNLGPARGSGILTRRGGRYVILQYNLALTIPNERFSIVKQAAGDAQVLKAAKDEPLVGLAWLTGAWVGVDDEGVTIEEHWTHAHGGSLLGAGRSSKDGRLLFYEFLRIEKRAGDTVFVAMPRGGKATEFVRVSSEPNSLVVVNEKHDFPKRISYRKNGEAIVVRISAGAKARGWTLRRAVVAQ